MQKKIWVTLISLIIFISCAVLSVSVVYRVNEVTVQSSLVSKEAEAEAALLQRRLEEVYDKESVFFITEKQANEILKDFPYFRLTGFEVSQPNRLIVKIVEDAEVYAVERVGGGYYVLGEDGMTLGVRDTYVNELNGAENVIIKGVNVTAVTSGRTKGKYKSEFWREFRLCH